GRPGSGPDGPRRPASGARRPAGPPAGRTAAPAQDDAEEELDWPDSLPDDDARDEAPAARRRLAMVGLPLLALALVVAIGWWFGSNVLSVAGNVDTGGSTSPVPSAPAAADPGVEQEEPAPEPGAALPITDAAVFDPFGDGEPENDDDVPLTTDGDPSTAWSTLTYRGTADFGNLKPGVGVVHDLGSEQSVAAVQLATTTPGATVEIRTGGTPQGGLDSFDVAATAQLTGDDQLSFETPVDTRYVLVWITSLVPAGEGFAADLAEVAVSAAA
ncbi:hypothetical protein A7K94_0207075, partial [Modestobacter sp. VKM Ac-2676]